MATAVSSLGYDDFIKRVSRHLGLDTVFANLITQEQDLVDEVVQDGVRRFYNARDWRFLKPTESLIFWADIALTTTVKVSGGTFADGSTPITATVASFHPLMVGKSLVITTVATFVVDGYTSPTVISVTGDASTANADTFSLSGAGDYTLDADFASLEGRITYDTEDFSHEIVLTSENEIRIFRQTGIDTGIPSKAAVRIREVDGTTDHRIEFLTWPIPDKDYTVSARLAIHPTLLSTAEPFALGGPQHSLTVLAACLAAAELEHDDIEGPLENRYQKLLFDSINRDRRENAPEHLGMNRDRSDGRIDVIRDNHIVQVNGVTP